ncbi:hypothetical protein [Brachybacterium squillarum]|uniref:hypothetical protein n=1 Tax=Brachybacterium squillarum TaxID=661979 RepID=UPI0002629779|nr:hypothetical protein [Brachybacterium squillarum]
MLRYLILGIVVGVLLLRLLRTRPARRLLRLPLHLLDGIHLAALTLAVVIAIVAEEWVLLAVLGALLIWALVDVLRDRRERAAAAAATSETPDRAVSPRTRARRR